MKLSIILLSLYNKTRECNLWLAFYYILYNVFFYLVQINFHQRIMFSFLFPFIKLRCFIIDSCNMKL